MPVPKGKQRRKPRNRVRRVPTNESAEASSVAAPKTSAGKPMRRARRQPPLWLNILLGLIMVVAGPYFTFFTSAGLGVPARVILLLGYFLIGGYYFVKAYRQYRERAAT